MNNFLKNSFFHLYRILFLNKYIENITKKQHLTILNLHQVSNKENPFYEPLKPEIFEKLLIFLQKNFNIITFNEVDSYKHTDKPAIILSFDDGYKDFKDFVHPILKKYNIRVNLNVIPTCIESGEPVWEIVLLDFLNHTSIDQINQLTFCDFNLKLTKFNKSKFGLLLVDYIKNLEKKERDKILKQVKTLVTKNDIKLTKMLNKEEIIELSKYHEIGSHSYTHESMSMVDQLFFENDYKKSEDYFRNVLKIPMNIYAFPSGSYTQDRLKFLTEKGIKYILLVDEKYANYDGNVFTRFTYYANSADEMKMRAVGFKAPISLSKISQKYMKLG